MKMKSYISMNLFSLRNENECRLQYIIRVLIPLVDVLQIHPSHRLHAAKRRTILKPCPRIILIDK
jgi:hypothetical protein